MPAQTLLNTIASYVLTELFFTGRLSIGGSMIGGIRETQEMLDFCGKHNVVCKCEIIPMQYINTALERLVKNDVKYRFVIDVQSSCLL